jgi:hypothetical protein
MAFAAVRSGNSYCFRLHDADKNHGSAAFHFTEFFLLSFEFLYEKVYWSQAVATTPLLTIFPFQAATMPLFHDDRLHFL